MAENTFKHEKNWKKIKKNIIIYFFSFFVVWWCIARARRHRYMYSWVAKLNFRYYEPRPASQHARSIIHYLWFPANHSWIMSHDLWFMALHVQACSLPPPPLRPRFTKCKNGVETAFWSVKAIQQKHFWCLKVQGNISGV